MLPQGESANFSSDGAQVVPPEKSPNRDRTQLNADDFIPLAGKPDHVKAFAAERDKHPTSLSQIKTWPEFGKELIHRFLVKISSLVSPTL
jgi:hypothetical protein